MYTCATTCTAYAIYTTDTTLRRHIRDINTYIHILALALALALALVLALALALALALVLALHVITCHDTS